MYEKSVKFVKKTAKTVEEATEKNRENGLLKFVNDYANEQDIYSFFGLEPCSENEYYVIEKIKPSIKYSLLNELCEFKKLSLLPPLEARFNSNTYSLFLKELHDKQIPFLSGISTFAGLKIIVDNSLENQEIVIKNDDNILIGKIIT